MKRIHIFYTEFEEELSVPLFKEYLKLLPIHLREQNLKYLRWQDRHSNLFGKLLLAQGIKDCTQSGDILNEIRYNEYSRPFINRNFDFNISHSGKFVVCAIGNNINLGIDIEEIRRIDFSDFDNVMTVEQWKTIKESCNPLQTFFKFWTIKESVIKADSRGLSIPLLDLHVKDNEVHYDDQIWYLKELNFDLNYCACFASNVKNISINIKKVNFYNKDLLHQNSRDCFEYMIEQVPDENQ